MKHAFQALALNIKHYIANTWSSSFYKIHLLTTEIIYRQNGMVNNRVAPRHNKHLEKIKPY